MSDVEMESINGDDDDVDIGDVKGILTSSEEEGEICDSDGDQAKKDLRGDIKKHSFLRDGVESTSESVFGRDELAKMGERVKRFGVAEEAGLYCSLGVGEGSEGRRHARLDTIHMYGTQNMDTNDVFQYFYSHKPLFLEWVNDLCCNIVWPDDISAARAMIFYSKEMDQQEDTGAPAGKWRVGAPHPKADSIFLRFATRSDKKVTGKEKLKVLSKKYKDPQDITGGAHLHPGLISRSMKSQIRTLEADPCMLEEEKTKNPWGELCQTWGINDSQEVFGVPAYKHPLHPSEDLPIPQPQQYNSIKDRIGRVRPAHVTVPVRRKNQLSLKMRLGKRTLPSEDPDSGGSWEEEEEVVSSEEEWTSRSKMPRMRMHADDEQEKIDRSRGKSKPLEETNTAGTITVEIKNEAVTQRRRARSRVGHSKGDLRARLRRRRAGHSQSSGSGSDDEGSPTVWARLDGRVKEERSCSPGDEDDVRYAVSKVSPKVPAKRPGFEKTDLRSRLGKKKVPGSPLRIEVDNEHYYVGVHSD